MSIEKIVRKVIPPCRNVEELRIYLQQYFDDTHQILFQPDHSVYVTSVVAAYDTQLLDNVVIANGTFTVSLPAGPETTGRRYTVKNIGSGVITVDPIGTATIENAATYTLVAAQSVDVVSDGTNYWII